MRKIELLPIPGIPEVRPGDNLADQIIEAAKEANDGPGLLEGDVVVVTQKVVSKAEGRLVPVDPDDHLSHKQHVMDETVRVVRKRGDLIISETRHGFVCANAGVDLSNVERGQAAATNGLHFGCITMQLFGELPRMAFETAKVGRNDSQIVVLGKAVPQIKITRKTVTPELIKVYQFQ